MLQNPGSHEVTYCPLTALQDFRLEFAAWAHRAGQPMPQQYDNVAWRLAGDLSHASVEHAVAQTMRRHDALTATYHFRGVDERPLQLLHPGAPVEVHRVDLRAKGTSPEIWGHARKHLDAVASGSPPMNTWPQFKAILVQITDTDHVLCLSHPWLMLDHWGFEVMVSDLAAAYTAHARGEPLGLEPATPFSEFAWAEHTAIESRTWQQSFDYWADEYRGESPIPALALIGAGGDPGLRRREGGLLQGRIPDDAVDTLRETWHRLAPTGVTPYVFMLAALLVLLRRQTGQQDIGTVIPAANRNDWRFHGTAGLLASVITPRFRGLDRRTFGEACELVRDSVRAGLAHQRVPYQAMIRRLEPERYARPSEDAVCYFDFWSSDPSVTQPRFDAVPLDPFDIAQPAVPGSGLALTLSDLGADGVGYSFSYARRHYDAAGAGAFIGDLVRVALEGAAKPDRPFDALVRDPQFRLPSAL